MFLMMLGGINLDLAKTSFGGWSVGSRWSDLFLRLAKVTRDTYFAPLSHVLLHISTESLFEKHNMHRVLKNMNVYGEFKI